MNTSACRLLGLLLLWSCSVVADLSEDIIEAVDQRYDANSRIAKMIWEYAETSFQEEKSSALVQEELKKEGFRIKGDAAGMPTGFIASYGKGKPVIAILAEFDALPGISQDAAAKQTPIASKEAGHACGHNLFAAGSVGAAVAVKDWMKQSGQKGTLRVYGTPAEEGGGGKAYFVRDGLLDDVDIALHWHPADRNDASPGSSMAILSSKFDYQGYSSHAAHSPHHGRSALDGVEAFNYMMNLMREHVPADTRIHYVITKGGNAPNVVPDEAEVHYFVRSPRSDDLLAIWERVQEAAKGAAQGTGTQVEIKLDGGVYNLLPNHELAKVVDKHLRRVGGVEYSPEELKFAQQISQTFVNRKKKITEASSINPMNLKPHLGMGSTDVGDVSWTVPTVGLFTATWVPGTTPHSWQSTAASGMSIGFKGAQVAAKVMALTTIELFQNPELRKSAWQEFRERRGSDFVFRSLLGKGKPPVPVGKSSREN